MDNQTKQAGFISIVGAPNVGKSTLINRLVGTKVSIVSPKVQTTRTRVLGIRMEGAAQVIFVDTPGIFAPRRRLDRAMVAAAWSGAEDADEILLLIDCARGIDGDTRSILERLKEAGRKAYLVLNKIDLVKKPQLLELSQDLDELGLFDETFMISAEPFPGEDEPKTVKTPNPLRMLADGLTRDDLDQVMVEVAADLNMKKVESHVEHLLWAIEKIKNFTGVRDVEEEIRDVAGQIIDAAADLNARIDDQALSHVKDLCDVLVRVSTRITSTGEEISTTDLELLPNLGQAIELAFSQGETAEQDAKLILESLE